jgi:hypothetical protein
MQVSYLHAKLPANACEVKKALRSEEDDLIAELPLRHSMEIQVTTLFGMGGKSKRGRGRANLG